MKKLLTLILIMALALTLTFILSGCSGDADEFEGKNIVTFNVNGGILNYGTSSTKTSVKFAYYPGTYILDPTTDIPNYTLSRNGYDFTGWYTDENCTESSKWNFDTLFDMPELTLYAGWEKSISHTFSVYYVVNNETEVKLGDYAALAGDTFSDWKDIAALREGYTCTGYYSDKELTTPWDPNFAHPGGETDCDIAVYADYIEGEWNIVSNYDQLKNAMSSGNVYLTTDIDCEGKELNAVTFSGIFNGNGYKISNFKVIKSGTKVTPTSSIFKRLASTAEIKDITFENVTFDFTGIEESIVNNSKFSPKVAALTIDMQAGAKVTNVTISGTFVTGYEGEFPCVNSVYFYEGEPDADVMAGVDESFSANITVNVQ